MKGGLVLGGSGFSKVALMAALVVSSLGFSTTFLFRSHAEEPPLAAQLVRSSANQPFVTNKFLVKLKTSYHGRIKSNSSPLSTGLDQIDGLNKQFNVQKIEPLASPDSTSKNDSEVFDWTVVTLPVPQKIITRKDSGWQKLNQTMDQYRGSQYVEEVEPDFIMTTSQVPNDPLYKSLWAMQDIHAEQAWDKTTGSKNLIVADIDTGIDSTHPDIKDNLVPGWSFVTNTRDTTDDNGHGSHTAGTIAAIGNNGIGVTGVAWGVKIMPIKFLDSNGSGTTDAAVKALVYAADHGAKISSNSWGCECTSAATDDAVKYEHDKGMVVVVAAGNSHKDALDFSPASSDGAITVAATDQTNNYASFSNFGSKIDIAAPGVGILSLKAAKGNLCPSVSIRYCDLSGTSMATPHVTGLAALLLSKNPDLTNEQVRQLLRTDAQPPKQVIDAGKSVTDATKPVLAPYITNPVSRRDITGHTISVKGSIEGGNFASYSLQLGVGREPDKWQTIKNSTDQVINGILGMINANTLNDGQYSLRLNATDKSGKTYSFVVHDLLVDNFNGVLASTAGLSGIGAVRIIGSAQVKTQGVTFSHYVIDWRVSGSSGAWSQSGVTLADGGTKPVGNGKLGSWDTRAFAPGSAYDVRLTTFSTSGLSETSQITTQVDPNIVPSWPIVNSCESVYCDMSQTMADINGDGQEDLITFDQPDLLTVYRRSGSVLSGFPIKLPVPLHQGSALYAANPPAASPVVADIDGDGKKEIAVTQNYLEYNSKLSIYYNYYTRVDIVRAGGGLEKSWKPLLFNGPGNFSPALADLNGDGRQEMIIFDPYSAGPKDLSNPLLHAYLADGSELAGFPQKISLQGWASKYGNFYLMPQSYGATVYDINHDGKPEIVLNFGGNTSDSTDAAVKSKLFVLNSKGVLLPGWPIVINAFDLNQSPTVLRQKSGQAGIYELLSKPDGTECKINAWDSSGTVLSGWPKTVATPTCSGGFSPVGGSGFGDKLGVLSRVHHLTLLSSGEQNYNSDGRPAILSDVNGDGVPEIITTDYYNFTLQVLSVDGGLVWNKFLPYLGDDWVRIVPRITTSSVAGGVDVWATYPVYPPGWCYGNCGQHYESYVWHLPNSKPTSLYWPMDSHDNSRAGNLDTKLDF